MINLSFNLKFSDLYSNEGLKKIDGFFLDFLKEKNIELFSIFLKARKNNTDDSSLIISVSTYLEEFIAKLFNIEDKLKNLQIAHHKLENLYLCKKKIIQRRALKKYSIDMVSDEFEYSYDFIDELEFANTSLSLLEDEEYNEESLDKIYKYAAYRVYFKGQDSILFCFPQKIDNDNLIKLDEEIKNNIKILKSTKFHQRKGFNLSDKGASLEKALDQANYCIFCHNNGKDSCSKGLKEKDDSFKINNLQIKQIGCPLEEKISEMNFLKSKGYVIGSLAVAMIENPLLAATGNRICNECMRSCIYQKQEAVNIPQIESRVLKDVLDLDWGFEIYSLLTRYNPLNFNQYLPKDISSYKILIAGLGPAGFSLSHYLLNSGHMVVAIDGLKIEPLEKEISGIDENNKSCEFKPIKNISEIFENLDERIAYGFGGVSEYGITVRWDKNYLKIIRLLLERRKNFRMFGGVRFGSQINYEIAKKLGFDHISLAMGAGKPNLPMIKNIACKSVKTASDFLMSLQLGSAHKYNSSSSLQIRLPVVVIGGGLTAIDAATESLCYYPIQVINFFKKYKKLCDEIGEDKLIENLPQEDKIIAQEFIQHAKKLEKEDEKGKIKLLKKWGGVKIIYRKGLKEAPSYRINHEEFSLAMQEQIEFIPDFDPVEIVDDEYNCANYIVAIDGKKLAAKTIIIATGTSPNTILSEEDPVNFIKDKNYFQGLDIKDNKVFVAKDFKPREVSVLIKNDVSFFGDLHPSYSGSVVKAIASAKYGSIEINKSLQNKELKADYLPDQTKEYGFFDEISDKFTAKIKNITQLADKIYEIIVYSPFAAINFKPGQFFKLQSFERNNKFPMEGLALTGSCVDKENGTISLIILESGASSYLASLLIPGEKVILMGPTGQETEIKPNENVMLIGGGLGNAVLFSIGKAFKEVGSKVLYFAGYRKASDRFKIKEIEDASDIVVFSTEDGLINDKREQDFLFKGNIIDSIEQYAKTDQPIKLSEINRIIAIGSDSMMHAVQRAKKLQFEKYFNSSCKSFASVNSTMQCMMKEICGQCLQRNINPETGIETFVYSCKNQDQDMDHIDFDNLKFRLKQNSLLEKINYLTLKYINN